MIAVTSNDAHMISGIAHVVYRILSHVENTQAVCILVYESRRAMAQIVT